MSRQLRSALRELMAWWGQEQACGRPPVYHLRLGCPRHAGKFLGWHHPLLQATTTSQGPACALLGLWPSHPGVCGANKRFRWLAEESS